MTAAFTSKYTLAAGDTVWVNSRNSSRETVGAVQQVRQAQPVDYNAPLTGASIVPSDQSAGFIIDPAGTIAALTVTMPANPLDGQTFFLASTQTVSTLTQNAAAGQTLNGALTTISATRTTGGTWAYHAANKTWYVVR